MQEEIIISATAWRRARRTARASSPEASTRAERSAVLPRDSASGGSAGDAVRNGVIRSGSVCANPRPNVVEAGVIAEPPEPVNWP